MIGSAIGLYYYLRAMVQLFLRPRWVAPFSAPLDWACSTGGGILVLLMLAMLWLGIYPGPFIAVVREAGLTIAAHPGGL